MGVKKGDSLDEHKRHPDSCGLVVKIMGGGKGFEKSSVATMHEQKKTAFQTVGLGKEARKALDRCRSLWMRKNTTRISVGFGSSFLTVELGVTKFVVVDIP